MNGPEHYAEAERLITEARGEHGDNYVDSEARDARLAEAQVHATLALVAATAGTRSTSPQPWGGTDTFSPDARWSEVLVTAETVNETLT